MSVGYIKYRTEKKVYIEYFRPKINDKRDFNYWRHLNPSTLRL